MSNTKCPQCGLVNWLTPEVCERCGSPLGGGVTEAPASETSTPEAHASEVTTQEATTPEAPAPQMRPAESTRPDVPLFTLGSDVTSGSRTWKLILAAVVVVTLGGGAWGIYKLRSDQRGGMFGSMRKQLAPPTLDERTRDTLLSCLAQPGFVGTKLADQVLGPAKLELVQVAAREVYFSSPEPELTGEAFDVTAARFVIEPEATRAGAGRRGTAPPRRILAAPFGGEALLLQDAHQQRQVRPGDRPQVHLRAGDLHARHARVEQLPPEQEYLRRAYERADGRAP